MRAFILLMMIVNSGMQVYSKEPVVIGLMPTRNEASIVVESLKAFAQYVDKIIILDDASTDETVSLVKECARTLPIVEIIENEQSYWECSRESDKRQVMLDTGRRHGGTVFVLLDTDEVFTALCLEKEWLKNTFKRLKPGQIMYVPMVHVWKGLTHYRADSSRWSPNNCIIGCAFGDDGICNYTQNHTDSYSGFIHMSRLPKNLPSTVPPVYISDVNHSIIHFRFAHWQNVLIKRAWYMCLELIRGHHAQSGAKPRSAQDINYFYRHHEPFDDSNARFKAVPADWYAYADVDFSCFELPVHWRKEQVKQWFNQYGTDFFKELDIWHINWD